MHALGVLVQLGPAGAAAHLQHLGHAAQQGLGQLPDALDSASARRAGGSH
jgi:hypothetical protein